jgi:Ser/Thr protein kinase RdoA (MazF antagonist)
MTDTADPFAAIAEETPAFSEKEAIAVALDRYGLDVSVRSLVSERDQNFHLLATDGRQYVLKIANAAESRAVTDFQIRALIHIATYVQQHSTPIFTPIVQKTLDGLSQVMLSGAGGEHVARVVSYVKGIPIEHRVPSARLCRNMGVYLAHLGAALKDFEHPGSAQSLLWDLQQALRLRDLQEHIPTDSVRQVVARSLDEFEEFALPGFPLLRRQVIHNDFNPDNILTDAADPDVVAGVIDFGDMLAAPLIADVAIGASYARPREGDPLSLVAEFLAGYHSITPLTQQETDMLFELIKARLCASIAILYWRASFRDPGDPYLEKLLNAESFAEHYLAQLAIVPRQHALQVFRQTCASENRRKESAL